MCEKKAKNNGERRVRDFFSPFISFSFLSLCVLLSFSFYFLFFVSLFTIFFSLFFYFSFLHSSFFSLFFLALLCLTFITYFLFSCSSLSFALFLFFFSPSTTFETWAKCVWNLNCRGEIKRAAWSQKSRLFFMNRSKRAENPRTITQG